MILPDPAPLTPAPKRSLRTAFLRPSTLALLREARRLPGYRLFDLLHGYVYGRWIYAYIALGTGRHPLAKRIMKLLARLPGRPAPDRPAGPPAGRGIAESYHGKVVPLQAARQLVLVHEDVRLENLETIIPYARARDLVLQNPDHLVVLDCPCRASKENPCLPLDVCLVVGEPFASFVTEHHPQRSRRITPQQAVDILQAEDRRGHAHHAFFKDAMLGRFYAICNCCSCCCAALHAHNHGTPMLAASGYRAEVNEAGCIGCEECVSFCQFGALHLDGFSMTVHSEACMGCGVCVSHCIQGALALVRDPGKGEPLEILKLMQKA
jgi:Pyruvate/2-oxoacid:ferredoxin oxidoreductase delta subunit